MDNIKKLIKAHYEWFLGGVALFLFAVIVMFFAWGITMLVQNFAVAFSAPPSLESQGFDIERFDNLNLRGFTR